MSMPIVISVPHGGAYVPVKLRGRVLLSRQQLRADSDADSPEIYAELVRIAATAELAVVARAIVDVNRAPTDFSVDGVIKTHTCWGEPIYKTPLTESEAANLIAAHHTPYHARLEHACRLSPLVGIDCHTMAALAPPNCTGHRPKTAGLHRHRGRGVSIGVGGTACRCMPASPSGDHRAERTLLRRSHHAHLWPLDSLGPTRAFPDARRQC